MMTREDPGTETPTRRHWVGYWSMIVQQTQNAFNDKVAQFMLIPLGAAVGMAVESLASLLIALPFVLFAPHAGWMSDRYSKRDVMLGAALAQVLILVAICAAVFMKNMSMAMLGFFALATQAAYFSPAKIGSNKELLGSGCLGFASGIQQMTAMLGMLVGQIVAGWIYDYRYKALGANDAVAWTAALLPLVILTVLSVPALGMAWMVPRVPAQGSERLRIGTLVRHFGHLKDLWRDPQLRRASFGMAFFWGFAAFINLWSVKLAKVMTGGHGGFGTLSSQFMGAASLGMIAGFGLTSFLLRRRIELGWVPLAGMAMTVTGLVLAFIPPGGGLFFVLLGLLALCSAVFLAPLNAWVQDRYPADQRGELQSAANLQNCLAGILAVLVIEGLVYLFSWFKIAPLPGIRIQLVIASMLCGLMAWFIVRLLPGPFLRVLCVTVVRLIYHVRRVNYERLPQQGGVLILPNHVTYADAFFISAACGRPLRFVMDETFMRTSAVRRFVSIFDTVAIRRDQPREAIRSIIQALQQGDAVCFFPEGQLTRTGTLSKLQRGFALIAKHAGHPLLPLWCDGSWGSVFSFERGRAFRKWPYKKFRSGLTVAFGDPIPPASAGTEELRDAMMKTSAAAIAGRFNVPAWRVRARRVTGTESVRSLAAEKRRRLWINGYQIGQVHALQRHRAFSALAQESACEAFPEGVLAFAKFYQAQVKLLPGLPQDAHGPWVGGLALRTALASATSGTPLVFYDFSGLATVPFERSGVLHCPCLAVAGLVVAMSMPNPPQVPYHKDVQCGRKPGTWGRLVPGWFIVRPAAGPPQAHGPSAPADGLDLPHGCFLDDDGFLAPG